MRRYAIRIFAEDLVGWVPLVCVVTMTSTLVGICVSQAVWTSSPAFAEATRAARLDLTGFQAVSVTIYAEVALIALFALTAVGLPLHLRPVAPRGCHAHPGTRLSALRSWPSLRHRVGRRLACLPSPLVCARARVRRAGCRGLLGWPRIV